MARTQRRPRHDVRPSREWLLKGLGFRYSTTREAYVLRVIGNRYGPVYRVVRTPAQNSGAG
jgi:hypothetical protein